jgi:hypothetical protein
VKDLFYPDRRMTKLGEKNRFEVISLGPDMQREAQSTQKYLHGFDNTQLGFGHWNAAGHAAAGKLIAQHFCEAKSADSPAAPDFAHAQETRGTRYSAAGMHARPAKP